MASLLSRIPYIITGDNFEALKKYDANSRKKIDVLGWFAIIPSLLWFITGYLLCVTLLETSFTVGLVGGVISGGIIFIFERSIVQSKKIGKVLLGFRILLALLVGLFSSSILDLIIFDNDIKHYASSGLVESKGKEVENARAEVAAARTTLNQEMEGGSGSKRKGYGKIALEKKRQLDIAESKLSAAETELQKTKDGIADQASSVLIAKQTGTNTILNRLKLLHEFVMKNNIALAAWIMLLVIGLILESFGVLTKSLYPKSAYEADVEAIELMMANKRKQALEQSNYYMNLGIHGRAAKEAMTHSPQMLN